MRAIVIATGVPSPLSCLGSRYPTPLLPVVDRPVLQHVVEALVIAGIQEGRVAGFRLAHQQHGGFSNSLGRHLRFPLVRLHPVHEQPLDLFGVLLKRAGDASPQDLRVHGIGCGQGGLRLAGGPRGPRAAPQPRVHARERRVRQHEVAVGAGADGDEEGDIDSGLFVRLRRLFILFLIKNKKKSN